MPIREPVVVFDIETIPDANHHEGDAFPKSLFHKIAAISYLKANSVQDEGGSYFAVETLRSGGTVDSTEEQLVTGFFRFIEQSKPRLVTFKDHRETVQRLFAIATMLASEAQEIAVAGQSPKLRSARRHALILKLRGRAAELMSIADGILTVTALADREG